MLSYNELIELIIDLTDGWSKWHEIKAQTGLSEKKCKEMELKISQIYQTYHERKCNGLGPI